MARASSGLRQTLRAVRSAFGDEKARSVAELPRTSPARPLGQVMPSSAGRRCNCPLLQCDRRPG